VKNLDLALAGFAIKIRQNPASVRFGKSKSDTTLVIILINITVQQGAA